MNHKIAHIHEKALAVAKCFRETEAELITVLQSVEEESVYLHQGYPSLFSYAVECLLLSEAVAYNFITVARKARDVPELKEAIQSGHITVSKARKITPVLTKENKSEWLEKASTLTQRKLEQEIARVQPKPPVIDSVKYVNESRLEFKMGMSEQLFEKFKRARDLTSQKKREAASLEATLEEILDFYLERQDPVKRAKRILEKRATQPVARQVDRVNRVDQPDQVEKSPYSALPADLIHKVQLRDGGRCTFEYGSGKRCEEQKWLQIHHKMPIIRGGTHSLENLTTLCTTHHKYYHSVPDS